MDLTDYLSLLRKRWLTVVATTLVVVIGGAALTFLTPKKYAADTEFFVSVSGASDTSSLQQGSSFTQQRVKSYAELLSTRRVLEPVANAVGGASADDLAKQLRATVSLDTVLIHVTVTDRSPGRAAQIASAIADTFPDTVADLELPRGEQLSPVKVTVVQPAIADPVPVSPRPVRNGVLAVALGLLLGFGVALLRHVLDTKVHGAEDVATLSDAPIIGAIHFDANAGKAPLIMRADPRTSRAEEFRVLRTNLTFVDAAEHPRTIVISSSIPGEGKTTTTANLGLAICQSGKRVCLVEADLRRPRLLEYLGMEGGIGLTDVLIGQFSLDEVLQPTGFTTLTVLGSGPIPPNPSELLGSPAMEDLLAKLAERFDYVIIDAPPILPVTDAVILSTKADGVVLVVGAGLANVRDVERTLAALATVDGNVLGIIVNRIPRVRTSSSYYSAYQYTSGSAASRKSTGSADPTAGSAPLLPSDQVKNEPLVP